MGANEKVAAALHPQVEGQCSAIACTRPAEIRTLCPGPDCTREGGSYCEGHTAGLLSTIEIGYLLGAEYGCRLCGTIITPDNAAARWVRL